MFLHSIVFDFDGVLANTEPLHLAAFREVLSSAGLTLADEEYYERYLGFDDEGVFRAVAGDRGLTWSDEDVRRLVRTKGERFEARAASQPCLFPGVAQRLREWASHVPVAIASGAFRREIESILAGGGVAGVVGTIVAAGETPRGKPAPDPFVRALELLRAGTPDLAAGRSVAIEDSVWGIASAREAGLKVAAVTTSYPAERLRGADLVAGSLADLSLEILDELAGRSPSNRLDDSIQRT